MASCGRSWKGSDATRSVRRAVAAKVLAISRDLVVAHIETDRHTIAIWGTPHLAFVTKLEDHRGCVGHDTIEQYGQSAREHRVYVCEKLAGFVFSLVRTFELPDRKKKVKSSVSMARNGSQRPDLSPSEKCSNAVWATASGESVLVMQCSGMAAGGEYPALARA